MKNLVPPEKKFAPKEVDPALNEYNAVLTLLILIHMINLFSGRLTGEEK